MKTRTTVASNKGSRRKCFWCGSKERETKPVVLWSGNKVYMCVDAKECRRK
jgi:hypothetical protein